MLNKEINKALAKQNFSAGEMEEILSKLASKTESPEQMAAFLIALRMKGETVDELVGAARFLRRKGQFIDTGAAEVMDIVGTGGDESYSFNISNNCISIPLKLLPKFRP